MLSLDEIRKYFPGDIRESERNMLREYLQYIVLDTIYQSSVAHKLIFLGGTAVRIIHGSKRFSEDLDFDNLGVMPDEFEDLADQIEIRLRAEGFDVELERKIKLSNFLKIKFPGLYYQYGLSSHGNEKLLIKCDAEPQNYCYKPKLSLLNKFAVFTQIKTVPIDLLVVQKITAFLERGRTKGRDIYDIVYLYNLGAKADMGYLDFKLKVNCVEALKAVLLAKIHSVDIAALSAELKAFLFNPQDIKYIELFEQFVQEKIN